MSANGRLTAAELTSVSSVEQLSNHTAHAYKALVAAGAKAGIKINISSPGGAYRSFKVQEEMREGSLGNKKFAAEYDLNPNSSVPLAAAGYSSHGTGTRVDLLFDGSSWPTSANLALAKKFGFTREFGTDDPNHFMHDGKTAITDAKPAAPAATVYTVDSGDTLSGIAAKHKTTYQALAKLNGLKSPYLLKVGQKIKLK